MAYHNPNEKASFNIELEQAKASLLLGSDFMRYRQEEDFDNMYNCLENWINHNAPIIKKKAGMEAIKLLDSHMQWLWKNKNLWCVKDKETGNITKIHVGNKKKIIDKFQEARRFLEDVLFDVGVTHKHKDDPAHAMRHFES